MADHYFTVSPESEHLHLSLNYNYRGYSLSFATDKGVFSRTEIDQGSDLLLSYLPETLNGSLLDMGCGYGTLGISIAKTIPSLTVDMVDVNERAILLTKENCQKNHVKANVFSSDGFSNVTEKYQTIVTNPPIRAGKQVIYAMFKEAKDHLLAQGALYIVIRKQQGAPSAKTYLETIFPSVSVIGKKSGFWIIQCINN